MTCSPTVTVTRLDGGALLVPSMVGVTSLVVTAPPPAIVIVGGGAALNRMRVFARVTASRESARPMSSVPSPTVIAPWHTMVPDRAERAPVPAAPATTQ